MKTPILRLVLTALCLCLVIALITSGIGALLGWKTSTQFSDGLFIAGSLSIVLGIFTIIGGTNMRADFGLLYGQSAGDASIAERTRRWVADMIQGYNAMILLFLTGVLLIGLSIVAGNIS
jgi:hypothetical protein